MLLGLLLLPHNRTAGAWSIWVVIAGTVGFEALLRAAEPVLKSQPVDMFAGAVSAVSFALACVWLLLAAKERSSRFKSFLLMGVLITVVASASYGLSARESGPQPSLQLIGLVLVLFCSLVISLVLGLAGLTCRGRYRPVALVGWSLLWSIIASALLVTPILVMALISNRGNILWTEFFIGVALLAVVSFGILLPFLLVSIFSSVFRERLQSLLRLTGPGGRAAMITPTPSVEMEVR